MQAKLIASTQLNMDAVDEWSEDPHSEESRVYSSGWKMWDYQSHDRQSTFTPVRWDDDGGVLAYGMEFDGEDVADADQLGEIAGRLCYKSWQRPNPATSTNQGYIANILAQAHYSVLEHASATFWLRGVSRSLTHELVRHRHLSFSQVSQRYVDESVGEYITHPALAEYRDRHFYEPTADDTDGVPYEDFWINPTIGEVLDQWDKDARRLYKDLVDYLVGKGVDRKTARGAARGVLPNSTETQMIITGNHRAWRDVLSKRLPGAADQEIRGLAAALLPSLKSIAPNTYQDMELTDYA